MGGNAFPGLTERKAADEYLSIEWATVVGLEEMEQFRGNGALIRPLPYYRNKQDFGDCDLLVENLGLDQDPVEINGRGDHVPAWFARVLRAFNVPLEVLPRQHYCNKPTYGFVFEGMQIDLILTDPEFMDTSSTYYAWNDLGNLMGRVAHKMGFEWGHEGLRYYQRNLNNTHVYGIIHLTPDARAAFEFMGYDYNRWLEGFDTLEQMFEFAASSPWFNAEIYAMGDLNSKNRVRNKKRTSYMKFLEWCAHHEDRLNHFMWDQCDRQTHHAEHMKRALQAFPHLQAAIDHNKQLEDNRIICKEKWNGNLVTHWTGLKWRMLSEFMAHCSKTEWGQRILEIDEDELERLAKAEAVVYMQTPEYAHWLSEYRPESDRQGEKKRAKLAQDA